VYSTLINLISGLLVYNNTHKLTSPPNCAEPYHVEPSSKFTCLARVFVHAVLFL
jgi:hypothetical protein